MYSNKERMIDIIKSNVEPTINSPLRVTYSELPVIEQYVIIQQNEEIIELLKDLKSKAGLD